MNTHVNVSISVDGDVFDVLLIHTSKTVWTATGDHKGKKITVSGSSQSVAEKRWQHRAEMENRQ